MPLAHRLLILGASLATLAGCSTHPKQPAASTVAPPVYQDSPSASLVFSAPVTRGEPPVVLAREPREPSVFIGYDEVSITSYYIRTDDRQTDDYSDRYFRRAVIEKAGVSYR